jgi:hypothetical protein
MAWGIRCTFDRIQSYTDAARTWRSAVIFRSVNRTADNYLLVPRGLVDRRKKHLTIERTAAEDFILRLYDHPVVTWHKDGSLTLNLHPTKSTGMFANHCTPAGMHVSCGKNRSSAILTDGLWYKASKPITFQLRDGKWKVADRSQITPWSVPVINRERAKQAFAETGYEEFRLWFKTYIQMAERPASGYKWLSNPEIVAMVRDRKWRDLVTCRFSNTWHSPDRVLHEIRQAIYRECGCIDKKSVPFLEN